MIKKNALDLLKEIIDENPELIYDCVCPSNFNIRAICKHTTTTHEDCSDCWNEILETRDK